MKTFKEIENDMYILNNEMRIINEKIKTEQNRFKNEARKMNIEEKRKYWLDTAKERETSENTLIELRQEHTRQKLAYQVMRHNAKIVLYNETLPTIIDVWNKYKGKRHGEKTQKKIQNEIFERTGNWAYVTYDAFHISSGNCYGGYDTVAYTNVERKILIDNVIQEITMDDFCGKKEYVDNIDNRVNELINKYREAMEKKAELEKLYGEFNCLAVENIEYLYINKNSYEII